MFRKENVPAPEMNNLLTELRAYMEDHKPKPVSEPAGGKYSFMDDYEEPSWNNPDNVARFTEYLESNRITYNESNIRDLYLEWELKNGIRKSFGSEVSRMVDRDYAKPSLFYNPVGIDKRTFHKIKTDYCYKPSKKTAFQCCIGLHLDVRAAKNLLELAGYALSPADPMDLIIQFCLEKQIWDMNTINFLLSSFDLEDLDG